MATCKECLHIDVCQSWIRHGNTLYSDFEYSTEDCPYFAEVKHGRWKSAGMGDYYCTLCQQLVNPRTNYCPKCGAIMYLGDKK